MPADSVLQIKVTLADIRPPIWRRLQVPADLTLGNEPAARKAICLSQAIVSKPPYGLRI
ncbi:hypothetical protein [Streptomyces sp. NPDC059349]|uniref:IS1096 element passenger TnpR family protein n=1 Tax=Streptomyces sp. NPDC059349 TaxID=3346808 RepID=UPI0036A34A76